MMEELLLIVIYCVLGTGLMLLGNMVVDWVIPCHFPTEIKKRKCGSGLCHSRNFRCYRNYY